MVDKKTYKKSTLNHYLKICTIAFLVFAVFANCVSAATLTVDPSGSGDHTTITAAVGSASSGDTIIVKPGTYNEDIIVSTNNLTIMSESDDPDNTIVQATATSNDVFKITSDNVTLKGVKLTKGKNGVLLDTVNNCIISNCVASQGTSSGINVYFSDDCKIINNKATSNTVYGISVGYSDYCNVSGNTVFDNNDHGIIVSGAMYTKIDDNIIYNNGLTALHQIGISHQLSNFSTVTSNNITDHEYGIQLDKTYHNIFYNNYFENDLNVAFSGAALDNIWNTTLTEGTNIIGGPYIGGNYWAKSDNTGFSQTATDSNEDGICDVQNGLDADNIDYLPLKTYIPQLTGVSGLGESDTGPTWINWSWTNPSGSNFNHSMVYLDGAFVNNVSTAYYNATGLNESTSYEIGIRTVDTSGNINSTWVNDTAVTGSQSTDPATESSSSGGGDGFGTAKVVDPEDDSEGDTNEQVTTDEDELMDIDPEQEPEEEESTAANLAEESQPDETEANEAPGFGILAGLLMLTIVALFQKCRD